MDGDQDPGSPDDAQDATSDPRDGDDEGRSMGRRVAFAVGIGIALVLAIVFSGYLVWAIAIAWPLLLVVVTIVVVLSLATRPTAKLAGWAVGAVIWILSWAVGALLLLGVGMASADSGQPVDATSWFVVGLMVVGGPCLAVAVARWLGRRS